MDDIGRGQDALAGVGGEDAHGRARSRSRSSSPIRLPFSWRPLELDDVFSDLVRDAGGQATMSLRGKAQRLDVVFGANYRAVVIYAPKPAAWSGPLGPQLHLHRAGRRDHQRAEPRAQRRVQRAAKHPPGGVLAGEFLDSSQRVLTSCHERLAFVLSVALLTGFSQAQIAREITFDEIVRPRPGEWPSYNGQLSANRHSPLDQINTRNVVDARAGVDARDGRSARAANDAARRRRRDVRGRRQRSAGAGCANRQADLAVRPAADARTRAHGRSGIGHQPRDRRARQSCFSSDRSRPPAWRWIGATDSCSGTWRWRTHARTTARPARCSSSTTSSSPASRRATKACADFSMRIAPRRASACGASGRCRPAANPDRKRGSEKRSSTAARRRG